jgi:EAL domain-containing protein (putative c-di-GMP-specific phosphodiesterase class I)
VETLMDEATLRQIIATLAAGSPGGLVIELSHAALAGLPEQGLAGLALLARAGAPLAVTEASISGLDLDALASLGVRFLGLSAASVDSGYGLSAAIVDFARRARSLSMQIIVTGVATSELALNLPRISRFGAGPFFAPPRRLKPSAGRQAGMAFDAAA